MFDLSLVLSTLLCALVAGFLFAYAIVVMPGIKTLDDKGFIKAFQVTDGVIQNNQPIFLLVWIGSAVALLVCFVTGFSLLEGLDFWLLSVATIAYLLGVQVSTILIHLPLNNRLQRYEVEAMNGDELRQARLEFEPRWNRSNQIRTVIACCVSLLLIIVSLRQ